MYQAGKFSSPLQPPVIKGQPGSTIRFISRAMWILSACVLVAASGGCSALQGVRDYAQYNDMTDDFVVGWRNYVWANRAWSAHKADHACEPQLLDFGEGFRAGYRDVASGSNGCPPPLPPRQYWSWKYQSPEGQAKTAAWFAGYPHGAQAAEEDGAGNWRQIPVSHVIQQQYSPEFTQAQIPRCDGSCFPQPTDESVPGPHDRPMEQSPMPEGVPFYDQLPNPLPAPLGASPVEPGQAPDDSAPSSMPASPPTYRLDDRQGSVPAGTHSGGN